MGHKGEYYVDLIKPIRHGSIIGYTVPKTDRAPDEPGIRYPATVGLTARPGVIPVFLQQLPPGFYQ